MRLLLVLTLAIGAGGLRLDRRTRRSPFRVPGGRRRRRHPEARSRAAEPLPADGYAIAGTALALRGTPVPEWRQRPRPGSTAAASSGTCSRSTGSTCRGRSASSSAPGRASTGGAASRATSSSSPRTAPGASHVGIAIGGDEFVHAPSTTRRSARRAARARPTGRRASSARDGCCRSALQRRVQRLRRFGAAQAAQKRPLRVRRRALVSGELPDVQIVFGVAARAASAA